jgi:tetratricopeptide (TPR) repeat protein
MVQRAALMNRDPDDCLSAEEVVAYLNGELRGDEKTEVDRHLDECRLCAGAIEGVAWLEPRQDYLNSAGSIRTRLRLRNATGTPAARQSRAWVWSAQRYFALAATVVVVAGATVYLTRPDAGDALFQEYFEPYPSTQPIVRGASADVRSNALMLYESSDYRGALAAFEDSLKAQPDNATDRFYAGLCQLALGRGPEAVSHLESMRKVGGNELQAPAEWYLALAYLRSHNLGEARSQLKRIVDGRGFYAERARVLLDKLNRVARHD